MTEKEPCEGCKGCVNQCIGGELLGNLVNCFCYGCHGSCSTYQIFDYIIDRLRHHNLLKEKADD